MTVRRVNHDLSIRERRALVDDTLAKMAATPPPAFAVVRDTAVAIGRSAAAIPLDLIDQAIAEAHHAESVGPILDPTLFMRGSDALAEQVKYLRAFRAFRAAIEEFRP